MASRNEQYRWADIRSNISALMANGRSEPNVSRYWYPLAQPSYGVEEVMGALESMVSFRTSMWRKTAVFEQAFGERFGGEAIMVNSGSSADLLIAFSLRVESGGPLEEGAEILVPSVTWPTQVWSLRMAGFDVRLVDTDPQTLNVDLDDLKAKIGNKTRAVSIVHLMGNPVNMDVLGQIAEEHELIILEDACESLGSLWRGQHVGTFGWAGAFSFFFSHHLVTMEGGMVLTTKPELAENLRLLRAHGWSRNLRNPPSYPGVDSRYAFSSWGFNVRPTELQAAFGIVQLERWELYEKLREENVKVFVEGIRPLDQDIYTMEIAEVARPNWFALPIIVREGSRVNRDELVADLEAAGIETRPVVAGNLARQPAARTFPFLQRDELPGADFIHNHGLYVGLHPSDDFAKIGRLLEVLTGSIRRQYKSS